MTDDDLARIAARCGVVLDPDEGPASYTEPGHAVLATALAKDAALLVDEVRRLRAELADAEEDAAHESEYRHLAHDLRKEIARLRAALTTIMGYVADHVDTEGRPIPTQMRYATALTFVKSTARAALSSEGT